MLILQSFERAASAPPPQHPQGRLCKPGTQEGFLPVLMQFTAAPLPKVLKRFAPDLQAGDRACPRVRMLGRSEQPASSADASLPLLSRLRQALSVELCSGKDAAALLPCPLITEIKQARCTA